MRFATVLLLAGFAAGGCGGLDYGPLAVPAPALVSVELTAPSPVLILGATTQLTARALDSQRQPIAGVPAFAYSSNNPAMATVDSVGHVTAHFGFASSRFAVITATAMLNGATASGTTEIEIRQPETFDFSAVMLASLQRPDPIGTEALGVAWFVRRGDRLEYTFTWSALSGPATGVHIHGADRTADSADVLIEFPPGGQADGFGTLSGSFGAADIRPAFGRPPMSLDALIAQFVAGQAYVDVHTGAHAGGEIRGQLRGPFR